MHRYQESTGNQKTPLKFENQNSGMSWCGIFVFVIRRVADV
jgi:hypothetical protein